MTAWPETDRVHEAAAAAGDPGLKHVIDTTPALIWWANADGRTEAANRYFLDYLGFSQEEIQASGWTAAIHPDDRDAIAAIWRDPRAMGAAGQGEARLRRHDGDYRWFLVRASPLRDEMGAILKWCGVNTDIEDRKQAEAELQRAYRDLAMAQRLSRTGSYTNDYLAFEHNWSDELYRIFEFELGTTITSEAAFNTVHPDDQAFFAAAFEKTATEGVEIDINYRIVTASGKTKHLHTVAHTTGWREKHPIIIGTVQDVTDTKVAEEARDKARSELAHAARAMSLGVLTASIAHEVNQPLSGIITNAGTSLRMLSADPPAVDAALETVRRTIRDGNRAAEVISRLRALFGRGEFAAETVDLNEAAREVLVLSAHELRRHQIAVRTRFAEDLPPVIGDRVQLQQVVINLILNAADAMKGVDGPRELALETQAEAADTARLSVRDTGVGVAADSLGKLFEAFYTTKADGMGIGLSVSSSIVERHGGRLWASQNDGPGATFSFSIPCAAPA